MKVLILGAMGSHGGPVAHRACQSTWDDRTNRMATPMERVLKKFPVQQTSLEAWIRSHTVAFAPGLVSRW